MPECHRRAHRVLALALVASATVLEAQPRPAPLAVSAAPATAQPVAAADPFRRETPRGTVLGFLDAARGGDFLLASHYLETRLSGRAAEDLARQLFVVLDARLPPRLTQISDEPEGSRVDPLAPDRERVGTIASASGDIDVYLRRVTRPDAAAYWLFSASTLEAVPRLHADVEAERRQTPLPEVLTGTSVAGLRLLDWLAVVLGIPLFFLATATLDRILVPLIQPLWRRFGWRRPAALHTVLPVPARLLLLALVGRWFLSWLPLSLLVRQFWSNAAGLIAIVAIVWLLVLLNGEVEELVRRRMPRAGLGAATSLLRVLRRVVDVLVVSAGFVVLLWHFGINPTPALAGLGVGGLAVALAAQKTLENVIAGGSLVFDQAVRVGDFLRMGAVEGTVDHIGLRSTRIRTLDRTIVSVPNSQIANASLETLTARDKYWFHPEVRLRYDTTPTQLQAALAGIRRLLSEHPSVDHESLRVRFIRLGPFSFDIEVFAYVDATDWSHFLELQEGLLFGITDAVERAGTGLALPSQTMYLTSGERTPATLPSVPAGVG